MKAWISTLLLAAAAAAGGCSLCAAPDDCAYSAFGGKWARHDMFHGRVGSNLSGSGYGHDMMIEGESVIVNEGEVIYEEGEVMEEGSVLYQNGPMPAPPQRYYEP